MNLFLLRFFVWIFYRQNKNKELNGGLNGGLNKRLSSLFEMIKKNPGIKARQIAESLDRPIDTVDKQVKSLVEKKFIERKGSKKTGGYYVK